MSAILLRSVRPADGRGWLGGDPVDVLVRDGRIAAIGPDASEPLDGHPAEVIDFGGRWLTPGLWDQHVHMHQHAMVARRVDVGAAASAAEVVAILRAHLETTAADPRTVLVGYGFRDALWPDAPTPELLDIGVPIALISGDVHCTWLNHAALRVLGRPETDWLLREQPAFELSRQLSDVPAEVLDGWVAEAAVAAARRGVVGIADLEMDGAVPSWQRRVAGGQHGLRVRAAVYAHEFEAAVADGIRTGRPIDGTDGLVLGGNLKIFTDGSLNTRTAYCHEPYPGLDGPQARGLATHTPEALVELARGGLQAGLAPTIHAIGDAATGLALDAFAALGPLGALAGEARIEHAQLVSPADVPRFAALGIVASVQPEHAMDDRDIADHYWAGRTARAFALRALLDAGTTLALGSDAPVAPLDPWITMAAAVTRSRDGRGPWHPEQRITPAEALAASTNGGSLVVGAPADLAVVDRDPLEPSGAGLREMPVAATMLGGRWTHRVELD